MLYTVEPRLSNESRVEQFRVVQKKKKKKKKELSKKCLSNRTNVRTHESTRWKRNAREWLPRQTEHSRTAGRVYPSSIVSVFEQIRSRKKCWNDLCSTTDVPLFIYIPDRKFYSPAAFQSSYSLPIWRRTWCNGYRRIL